MVLLVLLIAGIMLASIDDIIINFVILVSLFIVPVTAMVFARKKAFRHRR